MKVKLFKTEPSFKKTCRKLGFTRIINPTNTGLFTV